MSDNIQMDLTKPIKRVYNKEVERMIDHDVEDVNIPTYESMRS